MTSRISQSAAAAHYTRTTDTDVIHSVVNSSNVCDIILSSNADSDTVLY